MTSAQPFLSVSSSTDGAGLFTYTFSNTNASYIWGVFTNDAIGLPSHDILSVITPPGWSYSIEGDDFIHLRPDTQPVFLGEPAVTFSVLSSSTAPVLYNDPLGSGSPYARGLVVGSVFTLPDHVNLIGGYESFAFLGPQVPEPGFSGLIGLAGICLLARKLRAERSGTAAS